MTSSELVEEVLERDSSRSEDVVVSLHHVHLPKLREVGLVRRTTDGAVAFDDSVFTCDHVLELLTLSGHATSVE